MTDRRSTYRPRRSRVNAIDARTVAWFRGASDDPPWAALLPAEEDHLRRMWAACRDQVLADWVAQHPGSRPVGWWQCEAPEAMRRRLGGIGTPQFEPIDGSDRFALHRGIPRYWMDADRIRIYGRGTAVDPADPPVFESQAVYLDRLGLFLPGERARLTAADFEPERIGPQHRA